MSKPLMGNSAATAYRPVPPPPLPPRRPLSPEEEGQQQGPPSASSSAQPPSHAQYAQQQNTAGLGPVNPSSPPPPPPPPTNQYGNQGYGPPAGYQPMYPPQMYPQAFSPYGQLQPSPPTYAYAQTTTQYPQAYGMQSLPQQPYFQAPPMVGYPPPTTSPPVHGYQGPGHQQAPTHTYGQGQPQPYYNPPVPSPYPPPGSTQLPPPQAQQAQQTHSSPPSSTAQSPPPPVASYSKPPAESGSRPGTSGGGQPTALHQQPPEPYRPASVPHHYPPPAHYFSQTSYGPHAVTSPIDSRPAPPWSQNPQGPPPAASRPRPHSASISSETHAPISHSPEPASAPPQQESFYRAQHDSSKRLSSAAGTSLAKLLELPVDERSVFSEDALDRYRRVLKEENDLAEAGQFAEIKALLTVFFENEMNIRMDKYGLPKEELSRTPPDLLGTPEVPHVLQEIAPVVPASQPYIEHPPLAPLEHPPSKPIPQIPPTIPASLPHDEPPRTASTPPRQDFQPAVLPNYPVVPPSQRHSDRPPIPPTSPAPVEDPAPEPVRPLSVSSAAEVREANVRPASGQSSNMQSVSPPSKTAVPASRQDYPAISALAQVMHPPALEEKQHRQVTPPAVEKPQPPKSEYVPDIRESDATVHEPEHYIRDSYPEEHESSPPPTTFSSFVSYSQPQPAEEVAPPSTFSAILSGASWFNRKPQAAFTPPPEPAPPRIPTIEKPPQPTATERPPSSHRPSPKPKLEPPRPARPASPVLKEVLASLPVKTKANPFLTPLRDRLTVLKDQSWLDVDQATFDAEEESMQRDVQIKVGEREEAHSHRQMKLYAANNWQQADEEAKAFEEDLQKHKEAEMKQALTRWRTGFCHPAYEKLHKAFGEVSALHREITQFHGGRNVAEQILLLGETQAVFLVIMDRLDVLTDELRTRGYQTKIYRPQILDDWETVNKLDKEKKDEDRGLLEQRREFKMEKVRLHARCVKYLVDNGVEVLNFHREQIQDEVEKILVELGKREASEELSGQLRESRDALEMLAVETNALESVLEKSALESIAEETQPTITRAFNENNNWNEGERLRVEQSTRQSAVRDEHARRRKERDANLNTILAKLAVFVPSPVEATPDPRSSGLQDLPSDEGLEGEDELKLQMMGNIRNSTDIPPPKMEEPW